MSIAAPAEIRRILQSLDQQPIHPGLRLDRYLSPGKQEDQRDGLVKMIQDYAAHGPQVGLTALLSRLRALREHEKAPSWSRTTATPLTLHLARAGVLENSGILLHRVHGVPYLPGSSLKGLARAFAETVWAPSQPDPAKAWATLNAVFGRAAETDKVDKGKEKPWKPSDVGKLPEAAGAVVFHDAWPESWPQLTVDIVNCHHKSYYQGQEGKTPEPPGDWEDPEPSYFLAIKPGASFTFAVSSRHPGQHDEFLELVRVWLDAALTYFGFGAKTAGGYGYFREDASDSAAGRNVSAVWTGALGQSGIAECVHTLELITPAFLAGASQGESDCDLRAATLRNILRWWWRTLHAGYLDVKALRDLDARLWGDTKRQGLIQTILVADADRPATVRLFNYKNGYEPQRDFRSSHGLASRPDQKTTQGLFYLSYGMDELVKDKSTGQRESKRRYYVEPGARWRLRLIARLDRASRNDGPTAAQALDQARAALWLLTRFGAVGSKSRKGFGSLQLVEPIVFSTGAFSDLQGVARPAAEFRATLKLPNSFDLKRVESAALTAAAPLTAEPLSLPWADPWKVMDELGFAYQTVAQQDKHNPQKATLGLPRKIHGPRDDGPIKPAQNSDAWRPPEWLSYTGADPKKRKDKLRYASPIHVHVGRDADGRFTVQALFFPAPRLPETTRSIQYLLGVRQRLATAIQDRITTAPEAPPNSARGRPSPAAGPGTSKRPIGTLVQVRFLGKAEGKREGVYLVQETDRPPGKVSLGKPPDPPPAEGDIVTVYIHDDAKPPQYHWDPPAPPKSKSSRPSRRGGRY